MFIINGMNQCRFDYLFDILVQLIIGVYMSWLIINLLQVLSLLINTFYILNKNVFMGKITAILVVIKTLNA